ncbi:MAG: response regulator [Pseudomonadota bacterium]
METLLVVDDQSVIRQCIVELLKTSSQSHSILEATNGKQALKYCQQDYPSVVITDIFMPDMDGLELIQQLQQQSIAPHIVVLMDAYLNLIQKKHYCELCLLMGAKSVLDKEKMATHLLPLVESLLKEKSQKYHHSDSKIS